jgi:hypothetical protein
MRSIIIVLFLASSIIITYGVVNYYDRKILKKCKVVYMPRPE